MNKHKQDLDHARKLSNAEMETQKGGRAFDRLDRFVVNSRVNVRSLGQFNPVADTVMCAGQTRSFEIDQVITQARGGSFRH